VLVVAVVVRFVDVVHLDVAVVPALVVAEIRIRSEPSGQASLDQGRGHFVAKTCREKLVAKNLSRKTWREKLVAKTCREKRVAKTCREKLVAKNLSRKLSRIRETLNFRVA
jgi:hypothetical protein